MIKQKEKLYWNVYPFRKIVCIVPDGSNFCEAELVRKPWHFTCGELIRLDGNERCFFQSLSIARARAREEVMQPFLGKQRFAGIWLGKRDSVIIRSKWSS